MTSVVREPAPSAGAEVTLERATAGERERASDRVAVEEPLEIRLDGWRWTVTMRTPGHDADLVVGLLASEGAIGGADGVESIVFTRHPDEPDLANVVDVGLARGSEGVRARLERHQVMRSASCGLCGASAIEAILTQRSPLPPGPEVDAATVLALPERLAAAQPVFRDTGGLHAAGLFDAAGNLLVAREDIGRHNAVDKALGWRLRYGMDRGAAILFVSGRASFEIVQKALAAGVPILAAVSAPSSLAVDLARDAGMTLIGFVRGERMNVYTAAERIAHAGDASALEFIPREMRSVLDAVARKISLVDWQALTLGERRTLAMLLDTPAEFARCLDELVTARTGRPPRRLPPGA